MFIRKKINIFIPQKLINLLPRKVFGSSYEVENWNDREAKEEQTRETTFQVLLLTFLVRKKKEQQNLFGNRLLSYSRKRNEICDHFYVDSFDFAHFLFLTMRAYAILFWWNRRDYTFTDVFSL